MEFLKAQIHAAPDRLRVMNRWLVVAIGFAIPVSTSLTEILLGTLLGSWMLSGQAGKTWSLIKRERIAILALVLFAAYFAGIFYSSASWGESIKFLSKYRSLLYIPIYLTIFQDSSLRKPALTAFGVAMALTLILSFGKASGLTSFGSRFADEGTVFRDRITQNVMMSFAVYLVAVATFRNRRYWLVGSILIAAGIFDLLFLVRSRTGYLVLGALTFLLLYQRFRFRGMVWASVMLALLATVAYSNSVQFRRGIDLTVVGIQNYLDGEQVSEGQLRFRLYEQAFGMIGQHPIFGTGTGSFGTELAKVVPQSSIYWWDDTHNEYLAATVQLGLVGLAVLTSFLWQYWRATCQLPMPTRAVAQGMLATIVVGCLFNSLLMSFGIGHLFAYFTGLCFSTCDANTESGMGDVPNSSKTPLPAITTRAA